MDISVIGLRVRYFCPLAAERCSRGLPRLLPSLRLSWSLEFSKGVAERIHKLGVLCGLTW